MEPRAVIDALGATWAADDLDRAIEPITDDCVFEATGPAPDGTSKVGKTAIRQAWKPIFDDLPGFRD